MAKLVKPKVRRKKYFDHTSYFNEQLKKAGAEKTNVGWKVNGWDVKLTANGIYWCKKVDDDFKMKFPKNYEERLGKPYTHKKDLTEAVAEQFLNALLHNKSTKELKRLSREKKKQAKEDRLRLEKQSFCQGCDFATHKDSCTHMKSYLEAHGVYSCNNEEWWNWNWCYNAERVYADPKKKLIGFFNCKKNGKRCPYNVESRVVKGEFYLIRNIHGVHFTECADYEGHRVNPAKQVLVTTLPEPPKKRRRRK